jgi:enamine deaminase RidA (YjgF/YER057c/UK114 family)
VLAEADAKPEPIVRMTWYVHDKKEYLAASKAVGQAYRDVIGRHFPA